MKLVLTCFLTALTSFVYSQVIPEDKLADITSMLSTISVQDSIETHTITDSINIAPKVVIPVKDEYWIHTVYNPYRDVEVKFPLRLQFEDSTYASPIKKNKVVTSRYGWRRGRAHKGIDVDLVTGDSLYTMFDGIVRMSRYSKGHGRTVVVRHYNGLETVYAHLSKYGVKENDSIKKGDYIGLGGVSGNARGSHLHLVINYKGVSIHPEYLFEFNDTNKIRSKDIWITKHWTRPYAHSSKRRSKLSLLLTEDEAIASLQKQRKIYTVRKGDTLSRISSRNNVSIAALCRTNSINRNAVIKIGQKLVIEN